MQVHTLALPTQIQIDLCQIILDSFISCVLTYD